MIYHSNDKNLQAISAIIIAMIKNSLDKNTLKGAAWILLYVFLSIINEIVSFNGVKSGLHPAQMGCSRFFFSAITILPFMVFLHLGSDNDNKEEMINHKTELSVIDLIIRGAVRGGMIGFAVYLSLRFLDLIADILHISSFRMSNTLMNNIILVIVLMYIFSLSSQKLPSKIKDSMSYQNILQTMRQNFYTPNLWHHAIRGMILGCGVLAYMYSYMPWNGVLSKMSMSMNVMIGSALNPIATTLFAVLFFKDSLKGYKRFILLNLLGVGVVVYSHIDARSIYSLLFVILSVIFFGMTDIINKYSVNQKESLIKIMFYTNLFAALFMLPFAIPYWQVISSRQLLIFILSGVNGNIIAFCLIKSLTYTDLSSLQLLKHLKLPWAFVCDRALFHSVVGWQFWVGFLMIFVGSAWSTIRRVMNGHRSSAY